MTKLTAACLLAFFCFQSASSQSDYSNFKQQSDRISAVVKAYPNFAQLKSISKTAGGKDIWMITVGTGTTTAKPAIAVVGGVQGNHLLGTELAIGFLEQLLKSSGTDSVKRILDSTTYYIFPNMSPDAMEQYFSKLRYERQGNANPTDDDRDGKSGEDEYDDLNGDGKISWIRILSPVGTHNPHPDDPRAMMKANAQKAEKGKYIMLSEGLDNDRDGVFNEDGEGGVYFNKNFSFKPPSFTKGSGEFPVSEPDTRALLDQLYTLYNVFAVVSFAPENNLSHPVAYNAAAANQRIVAGYLEPDTKVSALVSEMYNNITGMKDAPKTNPSGGDFVSWAYFHFGRFSFSTPGWFGPKTKPDSTKKEKAFSVDDTQAAFLRFADHEGLSNVYLPWKPIQHPDFPGQQVEVGGIDPFVMINPPIKLIPSIQQKHNSFLLKLASIQPALDIANLKSESLGNGIFRVSADIINTGLLPATSALGEKSYWLKRVSVKLTPAGKQQVIGGKKIQLLTQLNGRTAEKLVWLIKGSGSVKLEAGAPTTGTKTVEIKL